jgi:glycosyltransferase involved in cell wall biosynthesis
LIIISQGHNSGGFEWARVAREISKPYALIVHCNGDQWWFGEHLAAAVESYTAALTVFCVAQKNLDLLRSQLGGEPLQNAELVWNPFNVSPQKAPAWPADSSEWRMACPARLFPPAKGQDLLLRTFAMQQWRNRTVIVNLYGSGPDEPALRRIAEEQHINKVRFCGHVSDIHKIWEQNHLLLLPSRYEGLPIVLVDAMWCARPAVVTDVGDNARMCVDGETGFVASAPTLASFSDALERAWEKREDWRQLGLAARKRAEDMIPVDPIPVFCGRLEACVTKSLQNC